MRQPIVSENERVVGVSAFPIDARRRKILAVDQRKFKTRRASTLVGLVSVLDDRVAGGSPPAEGSRSDQCSNCGSRHFVSDNHVCDDICVKCGQVVSSTMDQMDPTHRFLGISCRVQPKCAYERQNHCYQTLMRIQAKEKAKIPQRVIDDVVSTATIMRIRIQDITPTIMREILKQSGFPHYYAHRHLITQLVSGVIPPQFTEDQEVELIQMFIQSENAFEVVMDRVKAGEIKLKYTENEYRKNNLLCNYLLYKFCEIKGWTEFLGSFHLPLNTIKPDEIWEHECAVLGWPFVSTF